MAISKEKELLAQFIFTIFADYDTSLVDNDLIDIMAERLIKMGYCRIDKFIEWLKSKGMTQYDYCDYIDVDDLDELLEEYKNGSN